MEIKLKELISVGIDVGTTTSHLVFSRLYIRNNPFTSTNKYEIAEREILYRGTIFLTPLKPGNKEIDFDALITLLQSEYNKAGISQSDIETGAVIITGESARKENAEKIVEKLSTESGRFVAASAGPNFEAIISANGAGAVEYSRTHQCKLIHSDIGGGTTNIAVIDSGRIIATACINIGGRLIAYNFQMEIMRLEDTGRLLLMESKLNKELGDKISQEEIDKVARIMSDTLIDILSGAPETKLSKKLHITKSLPLEAFEGEPFYSFSGGVAEYIYGFETRSFNDLGEKLGQSIRLGLDRLSYQPVVLPERIRATVIGASCYTTEITGSTTYISPVFQLPIKNVPVALPEIDKTCNSEDYIAQQVRASLTQIDKSENISFVVLAFKDPVKLGYDTMKTFAKGIATALKNNTCAHIILVFESNVGNSVGNILVRETTLKKVLSIDEISLREGDFIDIGTPLNEGSIYPVMIKSLVFG